MKRVFSYSVALFAVIPFLFVAYVSLSVLAGFDGSFKENAQAECGLVFGAAVHSRSNPGPAIIRRVQAASDLFHNGRVSRLILTGGQGDEFQHSEASVMRAVAVQRYDIPSESVLLEERSTSTWENILFTRPLLEECESVVAISDRYHLSRIALIARKQGIHMRTYPAQATISQTFEMQSVIREIGGYMYYLFY